MIIVNSRSIVGVFVDSTILNQEWWWTNWCGVSHIIWTFGRFTSNYLFTDRSTCWWVKKKGFKAQVYNGTTTSHHKALNSTWHTLKKLHFKIHKWNYYQKQITLVWGNLTEFWGLFAREEKNTEEKGTNGQQQGYHNEHSQEAQSEREM